MALRGQKLAQKYEKKHIKMRTHLMASHQENANCRKGKNGGNDTD